MQLEALALRGFQMARRASRLLALAVALVVMAGVVVATDRNDAFIGYSEKTIARGGCERVDKNQECVGWASSGECERNPAYMSDACAKSCDSPCPPALGRRGGAPSGTVVLHTDEGDVRIALREDLSPVASAYFRDFARRQQPCRGCEFHRAEAVPEPGAIDNYGGPGPPYALVQGRLGVGARSNLPREGAPLVERGFACVVAGGPDFFVATRPHHEWGNGHTVFGEVSEEDMRVVDALTRLPVVHQTWGQTHVTALATNLPFRMSFEPGDATGAGADGSPLARAGALRGGGLTDADADPDEERG